jgi:hypothetical protein
MQKQNRDGKLRITDKGYEFMLRDIHVQAWMFVLALIRSYGMFTLFLFYWCYASLLYLLHCASVQILALVSTLYTL